MKRYFITPVFFIFLFCNHSKGQTESTVAAQLLIDENQYVNKPLDSIIAVLPAGYIRMKIYSGGHHYTARCLSLLYPDSIWIDLHVRQFAHMNPVDKNRVWNIPLMRQEKLYKTVIYKHNTCYRNCDVR